MLKVIIGLVITLSFGIMGYACNCETTLAPISKTETDKYALIFTGYVNDIHEQNKEWYAEFVVDRPFKGLIPRDIKILYDGTTSCQMHFLKGDQWLIYAKMDSVKRKWTVNYCERSRKFPEPDEEDQYTIYSGKTLDEELSFLAKNYNTGQIVGEDTLTMIEKENKIVVDSQRNMNYGSPRQKIILLICSLAGMIIVYLIIKKFVK